jgi:hypothetical protein
MEVRKIQWDAARIGDEFDRPEGVDVGKSDDRKGRRGGKVLNSIVRQLGGANLRSQRRPVWLTPH